MKTFGLAGGPSEEGPDSTAQLFREAWRRNEGSKWLRRDARVAVAAGSRGIADLPVLVRETVQAIRGAGAEPFLVPAMGSHGGATEPGQSDVLRHLGVTPESAGCPIRPDMRTEVLEKVRVGDNVFPLHFSREARAADQVVVVNRLKVHPRFVGDYESGLMKMLLVGLGKKEGAEAVHNLCPRVPFDTLVRVAGAALLRRVSVAFGVAVIENARHRVCRVEVLPGDAILEAEPPLLREAKKRTPRLPMREIDLLIVDRIGKDVAGTGMDPFAIGLRPDSPTRARRIVVLDLTARTAGNAHGIGFADFTTQEVWDKIDHEATRANAVTSGRPEGARLPIPFPTHREAVEAGIRLAGGPEARIVHILDTANLQRFRASESLWAEIERVPGLKADGEARPLTFDAEGRIARVEV